MKRFFQFLTAVLPFFAAEAVQYVVVYGLILFYGFFVGFQLRMNSTAGKGLSADGMIDAINTSLTQEANYLFSVIGILICGIVFCLWYRYEIRGERRGSLKNIFTLKGTSLIILLGIGCQFFFSGFMSLLTPLFQQIFSDYAKVVDNLTSGNMMVVILLMTLIAPITEELIFRGVILHMANRHIAFIGANIFQALLFGIYHGNIVQGIYASLLGFLLGMIYHKYKSIFAPIFLHVVINTSSFLTYLFPDRVWSYIMVMIVGILLAAGALFFIKPTQRIPLRSPLE